MKLAAIIGHDHALSIKFQTLVAQDTRKRAKQSLTFPALCAVQTYRSRRKYSVGSCRLHGAVMELWRGAL